MFDTDKFISEIEKRPALYDVTSHDYNDREMKSYCWNEIGEVMYDNWTDMSEAEKDKTGRGLMKKWKAIRDNFVREHRLAQQRTPKTGNKKKKYKFYNQLQFLLPYVKEAHKASIRLSLKGDHSTADDFGDEEEDSEVHERQFHTSSSARARRSQLQHVERRPPLPVIQSVTSSQGVTNVTHESMDFQKEQIVKDRFGNRAFLLSCLPMMDSLPQHAALDVRIKITEVFKKYCSQKTSSRNEEVYSNIPDIEYDVK